MFRVSASGFRVSGLALGFRVAWAWVAGVGVLWCWGVGLSGFGVGVYGLGT